MGFSYVTLAVSQENHFGIKVTSDHRRNEIFLDFREKAERKKDEGMKKIDGIEEIQRRKRSFVEIYGQWNVYHEKILHFFNSFPSFFSLIVLIPKSK